jgi:pyruvate,water dikinase
VLNVGGLEAIEAAVRDVCASGHADSARAYRRRQGLEDAPRVAVVLQRLVAPDRAGVLFTRDPLTGEDVRVIEASWGLGEAVVSGLVSPDLYRVARDGRVLAAEPGDKVVALRPLPGGGTEEEDVDPVRAATPCLAADDLARLNDLAARCEATYGPDLDLEWAIAGGELFLLQARAITRIGAEAVA